MPLHDAKTLELPFPLPPADWEWSDIQSVPTEDPAFDVKDWCPRCSLPSAEILTWQLPCKGCGYPGLKEESDDEK